MSEALDRPADRSLARPNCAKSIEERAPLAVGSPGPSFNVFLKQQHGTLIQLRRLVQPLLWDKRATLVEPLKVTVERRAVDSNLRAASLLETPFYLRTVLSWCADL